ncbi:hypothetical protein AO501_26675 [Mycobacterium gordonae]|uniref:Uncharacterized protein n=1 Tax=Mycobacterium gordonae TaxID=1778 RepID=A0A0Q2UJ86_MYCGO|nr:hypothetical protein [Mycobacterium gordonae]KQH80816.1 hypothetical protein AO501_26675 [Mycobacterium gordonae]
MDQGPEIYVITDTVDDAINTYLAGAGTPKPDQQRPHALKLRCQSFLAANGGERGGAGCQGHAATRSTKVEP